MHRGRGGSGGGSRRSASHPGVSGGGADGPKFVSPYQPPPSGLDLRADVSQLDPMAWKPVMAGGSAWRIRMAAPHALADLADSMTGKGDVQVQAQNRFVQEHMHPDDFLTLLLRLADPDDPTNMSTFEAVVRAIATNGTARPFLR